MSDDEGALPGASADLPRNVAPGPALHPEVDFVADVGVAVDWKGIGALTLLKAGVTRDRRGQVRIPYRYADGTTVKAKVFARNGQTWWSRIGVESIPLGLERLAIGDARSSRTLIIAEGESDTLAIRDALAVDHDGQPIDVIGPPRRRGVARRLEAVRRRTRAGLRNRGR